MRFSARDFTLDVDRRELTRGSELISLGPQVFDLLVYLVKNRDRVVSKDDLIEGVWGGRIVSESTLTSHINAVRKAVGDSGEEQSLIRTIARRGFRFVGEVKEKNAPANGGSAKSAVHTKSEGTRDVPSTHTVDEVAKPMAALALPDKPSIAVLPFANMSGDPEQEYFADGIVEDIIMALSRMRWLFVIARNSSFTYKGPAVDVKQVGRSLGVRYVLEGSVRKGGNRVRIAAQLIDASNGNHIWADRYDGELTDVFALQDEITKKVVAAIGPRLLEAEGIRSQGRSPEDLGAWDKVIQANSLFWRLTKADSEAAIAVLKQVIEHHADYAPAYSMLAFFMLVSRQVGWLSMEPEVKEAAGLAARAAELDDSDVWAHLALGYVAMTRRRTNEAVDEFQLALDLNPNFAAAHGYLGFALALDGRSDQAISHIEQAIRMSPHDPQNALFNVGLSAAHYLAGSYPEAIVCARKAMQQRFGLTNGHRIYIASLAQTGQIDEARAALARLQELHPENSIAWSERNIPYTPGPMTKFLEGLRNAGLK